MTRRARIVRDGFMDYDLQIHNGYTWVFEDNFAFLWTAKRAMQRYVDYGKDNVVMEDKDL